MPPLVQRFLSAIPGKGPGGKAFTAVSVALLLGAAFFLLSTMRSWPGAVEAARQMPKSLPLDASVKTGLWWGILAGAVLLLGLLLTRRCWARPICVIPPGWLTNRKTTSAPRRNALVLLALAAIVIFGAWIRLPRMDVSVYFDEMHTLRHYVHGRYINPDEGSADDIYFKPATWRDTLWKYREANNHVLFSICSRLCLEAWQELGPGREDRVSDPATRIPSLIAGLGTIFLAGWLLHAMRFSAAGIGAALLLALHPWHIRYSTETRGYAMNIFFVVLTLFFFQRALKTGRWRHWIGFSLAQFATLYAYTGSLYFPAVLNAVTIVTLTMLVTKRSDYPAKAQLGRLIAAGVFSTILFLVLMTPCLIQLREFLAQARFDHPPGLRWLPRFWTYAATGMQLSSVNPENPLHHSIEAGGWLLKFVAWGLMPAAILAGAFALVRNVRLGAVFALTWLLAGPVGFLHAEFASNAIMLWHLIFALPGLLMLAAIGFACAPALISRGRLGGPPTRLAAVGVGVLLFAGVTHSQREVIRHHGKEPLKEVITAIYGDTDPFSEDGKEILTGGFWSDAIIYDPRLEHAFTPEHLFSLMERALRDGKPLFFTHGHRPIALSDVPDAFPIIENPDLFRRVDIFWGLEETQFNHYLFEFIGDQSAVDTAKARLNNPVAPPATGG